jgi:transketolase
MSQVEKARDVGVPTTSKPFAPDELTELQRLARQVRADILRSVAHAGGGHIGGPLSAVEMLVALYFKVMNVRPDQPRWEDRDRFVLSKGHSSIGLYSVMAARGYFPREELMTFDRAGSPLQGHPEMNQLAGIDMSTGSLGQGISAAVGMAIGAKKLGKDGMRVYCMVGDGECQEGSVWEAAFVAERYRLDNLIVLVDFNKLQQFGWPSETAERRRPPWGRERLPAIWRAFGWRVVEVDGHDFVQLLEALYQAQEQIGTGVPTCIVAHTIKGKGVSFMENSVVWHAKVPNEAELEAGLKELRGGEIHG